MSTERSGLSLTDLVAVAVSPVLVMLMVGSLTFFLVDVLYAGNYSARLLYTMFFFVAGAVLVARIGIEMGSRHAGMYGLGLGAAVFVAMLSYVEYPTPTLRAVGPIINLGLMAMVWWLANKLTWDCTHLDEDRKASGRGLLLAAGLEESPDLEEDEPVPAKKKKNKKSWFERFQAYREAQKKKPHTPGTWVLYFGLAALPVFALGQSLISPDDVARRRTTFLEMAAFVGSGLGLLVTTSLLGLRRYLQERGARVPTAMTVGWLGLGVVLIVAFLGLGALLPRPHTETPWFDLQRAGKQDRAASKNAVVRDNSAGKGDGAKGGKTEAGDGSNTAKGGKPGGPKGDKGDGTGKGDKQGGKDGPKGDGEKKDGEKGSEGSGSDRGEAEGKAEESDDGDGSQSGASRLGEAVASVANVVKWIVWVLIALAVIAGVVLFVLKWLAPFTDWAKNLLAWFQGLFGSKKKTSAGRPSGDGSATPAEVRPPAFAEFPNPFADGSARRREPAELVAYTFAAFDAWAWERDAGRNPQETPAEFAKRHPDLGNAARVADLLGRSLYSTKPLPGDTAKVLAAFWKELEQVPVSVD
jgi:hypothetical protein